MKKYLRIYKNGKKIRSTGSCKSDRVYILNSFGLDAGGKNLYKELHLGTISKYSVKKKFHLAFPNMSISLEEQRNDYKKLLDIQKELQCYMSGNEEVNEPITFSIEFVTSKDGVKEVTDKIEAPFGMVRLANNKYGLLVMMKDSLSILVL